MGMANERLQLASTQQRLLSDPRTMLAFMTEQVPPVSAAIRVNNTS